MIPHTINSYWIPRIRNQNYKSTNQTKPGTYAKSCTNYYICVEFESSSIENVLRNAKKVQIIN